MVTLSVCIGSSCHLKGSYNVIQTFQQLIEEHKLGEDVLEFKASFCMKQCQNPGVGVTLGEAVYSVRPEDARSFFADTVLPLMQ